MRTSDPLLINYPVRIREVILGILFVLVLSFYLMPRFMDEVKAGDLNQDIEMETFDIPPTDMVEQQKPLKPSIPVPEDDEYFEEEMEFQGGQKKSVFKKVFPGYILVEMEMDDESWYVVRNTPGVTGFVSAEDETDNRPKPVPLEQHEVDNILNLNFGVITHFTHA